MKFCIKDLSSKCDQIRRKLRVWSHLLDKSLMQNFIFCAVIDIACVLIFRFIYFSFKVEDFIAVNKHHLNTTLSISFFIKCNKKLVIDKCIDQIGKIRPNFLATWIAKRKGNQHFSWRNRK